MKVFLLLIFKVLQRSADGFVDHFDFGFLLEGVVDHWDRNRLPI